MKNQKVIKLGLIGCGNFGRFCLKAFSKLPEIQIAAVADNNEQLARRTASEFHTKWFTDISEFLQNTDAEIIHIVTPPDTHYRLGLQAIRQGKHVLCEKPLALSLENAQELLDEAARNQLIVPVNFVLRYVPVVRMAQQLIQTHILGRPLRAYFENYATDEPLPANHWFWDKKKSGGIFVEHGVHFFDLYRYWFGEANVLWANTQSRHSTSQEDRVFCLSYHKTGVMASHYHGFDQPGVMDRQVHRILFETGDMVIEGWIPESVTINALVDEHREAMLKDIFPEAGFTVTKKIQKREQMMQSRGKTIRISKKVNLKYASPMDKQTLYANAIIALFQDQINFIDNRSHKRYVDERNGLEALKLALQAVQISQNVRP